MANVDYSDHSYFATFHGVSFICLICSYSNQIPPWSAFTQPHTAISLVDAWHSAPDSIEDICTRFPYHILKNAFHTGLDLCCLSKTPKATFCRSSWPLPTLQHLKSLTLSCLTFQAPVWLWSRLLASCRKLAPVRLKCGSGATAVPSTHLCTRRVVGSDLEVEFCQVNETRDVKKYHFSRDLESTCGGVRSRALN